MVFQLRQPAQTQEDDRVAAVRAATRQWRLAAEQFNEATAESQIDAAIYRYLLAQHRLVSLLQVERSCRTDGTADL